jgi:hypothetical protein
MSGVGRHRRPAQRHYPASPQAAATSTAVGQHRHAVRRAAPGAPHRVGLLLPTRAMLHTTTRAPSGCPPLAGRARATHPGRASATKTHPCCRIAASHILAAVAIPCPWSLSAPVSDADMPTKWIPPPGHAAVVVGCRHRTDARASSLHNQATAPPCARMVGAERDAAEPRIARGVMPAHDLRKQAPLCAAQPSRRSEPLQGRRRRTAADMWPSNHTARYPACG